MLPRFCQALSGTIHAETCTVRDSDWQAITCDAQVFFAFQQFQFYGADEYPSAAEMSKKYCVNDTSRALLGCETVMERVDVGVLRHVHSAGVT
ncbi:MAG: hypothetical protein EA415_04935 [Sphaerobacteraceae bacterium]|nr:MAG: hypothetical protein EA415_04935 [Sphaerobacteraceae bacterium]